MDADYSIRYVAGTLTVNPVVLTITASNQSKVYGAALPTLTPSYSGFVNGDTAASLTTEPTLTTTATASSHVSGNPYAITASGAVDSDYTFSYVSGILTVTPATLTITAADQTKVYGAALPALTASYSGFVNDDSAASLTTQPTLTTTAAVTSHVAGNPYAITGSGAVDTDYVISYASGVLTVTPAALTITANDQTKTYGAALPTLTASYSGFVAGDTSANLSTPPTLTTTATASSEVSGNPYTITASGAVDTDYTISYLDGMLNVTPAALLIAADNQTTVYGADLPDLTASYTGFVNGDTSASLTTSPTLTTTATPSSHVADNPYTITASGAVDADYTISYAAGTMTVTAAALLITADNQTKAYGADLPTLTASYSGFVNDDSSASLTTPPTLTTTATAASSTDGGPYAITAGGAVDPDYSISYVSGLLTVTPVALLITADDQTKIYGANLPTLTASYSGFVNGDTPANLHIEPTLATTASATSDTGDYAITASDALDPDYTISYVSGKLTVSPATLTVTADDQTRPEGETNPTLTYTFSGLVNGDSTSVVSGAPILSTTATIASPNGEYPIDITAGTLSAANYDFITVGGTLTIEDTPATMITITASPGSTSTYGQALTFTAIVSPTDSGDPTPTGTVEFEIDGVPIGSAVTLVNGSATSDLLSSPNAGGHTIEAIYSGDDNYASNMQAQTQTVTPAMLIITADDQSKVYGAAVPTLTASYNGFVNSDTSASLTMLPTLSTTANVNSKVPGNPFAITASGAVDSNYTISYESGILTVTPAPLTISADDQTMAYGAALPTLTVSYSGFVNGDTTNNLTTQPTITTTATASSHVSGNPYAITASGAVDPDYTISYVNGTLNVTPVALLITANYQTTVYGAALPALTASYTGFVNGDTSASLTTPPALTTTATPTSHVVDNPYTITASGAVDADYTISYAAGIMTVTPAALTITADNQTKVYGVEIPALTASYSGFVNGDTSTSLTTQPILGTTAAASSDAGAYPITASGAADPDYSISYLAGTLTVTQAPLTITADNLTKVYGAALPTLTASYTGFVNGDTPANLDTGPTLSTTATPASDAGAYVITVSGAADVDYAISFVDGTMTVTPAGLTITAVNQTKAYGAALPALTASYTGFVNGDTAASLTTPPTVTTAATGSSHVAGNPYPITASDAVDANYSISYVAGTLTVNPVVLTITATNQSKVYGAALPALTPSYSGFVNGDTAASLTTEPTLTTTATASSHVSGNPYAITASGAVDSDYTFSYVNGILTITPATLTITADNQTKVYGAALPPLTASYTGFVNDDSSANLTTQPTLSTIATSHSDTGVYAISVSGAVDSDYSITYVAGNLTVTTAPLLITADNQTKAYGAALPPLTASYSGFVDGDTAADLSTPPTLTTTATASSQVSGNPYTITASGAVDSDYTISYVNGTLNVTPAALLITADNQTTVYGGLAGPDGQLHRVRQWRHLRQPHHPAHADDHGHLQQPCRGQPLRDHRQRSRRWRLHHQLRRRDHDRHCCDALDHRRQPDQGLRRRLADADRQLQRFRQRRQLCQPDHPAHADNHGDRRQQYRRRSLRHHRRRRGRSGL